MVTHCLIKFACFETESNCFCMFFCGPSRSYTVKLYNRWEREMVRLVRPYRCDGECTICCCCPCALMKINVINSIDNVVIGEVKQKWVPPIRCIYLRQNSHLTGISSMKKIKLFASHEIFNWTPYLNQRWIVVYIFTHFIFLVSQYSWSVKWTYQPYLTII